VLANGVPDSVSFWVMPFRVMANAIVAVAISSPTEASPAADRIKDVTFALYGVLSFSYIITTNDCVFLSICNNSPYLL
jgi:hypothetical protein